MPRHPLSENNLVIDVMTGWQAPTSTKYPGVRCWRARHRTMSSPLEAYEMRGRSDTCGIVPVGVDGGTVAGDGVGELLSCDADVVDVDRQRHAVGGSNHLGGRIG